MSFRTSCSILRRASTQPEKFIAPGTRVLTSWTTAVAVVVLVAVLGVLLLPPGWAWAEDPTSSDGGSDETGIQVGAWALTGPHIPGTGALAPPGAVVRGPGC